MSFSRLRRRAAIVALATMLAALMIVGLYTHAVQKGFLPSPVQPFVQQTPPANVTRAPAPVSVAARAETPVALLTPVPAPPPQTQKASDATPPTQASNSSHPPATVREESQGAPAVPPRHPVPASFQAGPAQTASLETKPAPPPRPSESTPPLPIGTDSATETLAQRWATSTNARPHVRVRYDSADIIQLLRLRRGVLVARGTSQGTGHDVYLQDPAAPLFAPYTPSVAAEFSSYALEVGSAAAWTGITQTLPLYFSRGNVELAFVPDDALATQIFREVAKASRALFSGAAIPDGTTFEGQLRLAGDQPEFELLDVRRGGQHLLTGSGTATKDGEQPM